MKNPRFEDEAVAPLSFPDEKKIRCRDCMLREKDRQMSETFKIYGSTLIMCDAYGAKPREILFKNMDCPYYIPED